MLIVKDILYRYKSKAEEITYNFSLEVKRGEVVGITGASGNGKSTLLDLISGFLSQLVAIYLLMIKRLQASLLRKDPSQYYFKNTIFLNT